MEYVEYWSVTYTKHIKQKRKVYQDGFLELHSRSRKVILYDEYENVLDSMFVKKDDSIKSGETLAFDAYFVDIGDSYGENKPAPKSTNFLKDTKIAGTSESFQSPKFDRKPKLGRDKSRLRNLSPSQKIIREFKKNEMIKYGSSPGCPDTTKPSKIEWQVLYTTQITQKAKKYHDGFLQLLISGSQGKQAMLYDTTRRLLDSRFLKKDEVIRSGESVAFDGHLVDVGECQGDHKPLMDLNFEGKHCNGENEAAEWEAMYTTQLTQKTKKYKSGILKLANCGSYQMQAILLTEDGSTLSRRYVLSSESVRPGSTLQLQNYLVELGLPRAKPRGKATDSFDRHTGFEGIQLHRKVSIKKPILGEESQNEASPSKHLNLNMISSIDKDGMSGLRACEKPVRAVLISVVPAQEILSILKKPMAHKEASEMESQSKEGFHSHTRSGCILESMVDIDTTKTSGTFLDPPTLKPKVLVAIELDSKGKQPIASVLQDLSAEVLGSGHCTEPVSCKEDPAGAIYAASSGSNIGQLSEEVEPKNAPQSCADSRQDDARQDTEINIVGMANSNDCSAHDYCDDEEIFEQDLNRIKTDDLPSFDLGF